jgi:hypothetical protein
VRFFALYFFALHLRHFPQLATKAPVTCLKQRRTKMAWRRKYIVSSLASSFGLAASVEPDAVNVNGTAWAPGKVNLFGSWRIQGGV